MGTDHKQCNQCRELKSPEEFYRHPGTKDRRESKCKVCRAAHYQINKAYHAAYYRANKERAAAAKAEYRRRHRDDINARRRMRKYNLTSEQFAQLHVRQADLCAICSQPETNKRASVLSVDHDHATGFVRGLLCSHCNHAIGKLRDSPELLERAADYLRAAARAAT